ncbi:MAG: LysM peptidoglycan-binding domain-containing protein [Spirochaetes bacterium]|nr:LysM peptidoglycan-binding domain-containing protein [Spirochaetota bacterium]
MSLKDSGSTPGIFGRRTGWRRRVAANAGLLLALLVLTAAAGAQGYDPDAPSAGAAVSVPEVPPAQETAVQSVTAEPSVPVQETTSEGTVPELSVPACEPLFSCGILVDGLSYDLPMPWGQDEFEKTRASYLSSGGKKWLAVVMAQAMPYLSYVEAKVEEYGLPKELAYLPVIESEYSPLAVSTSGAAGLWQFMRNSIIGYGLSISEWVDDRKDFMKSTDAALRKLRDNQQTYNDWLLALAAYNAGSGAVSRAIRSQGDKSLDFWQLYDSRKLSREPLSYIPRFLAVASILRYPELHGLPAEWGERGVWEAVETTRQVDMNVLSEKAGIPLSVLKAGNAELKYHITPPSTTHTLKVPVDKAETVRTILADNSAPLYKYDICKVKSGDTMGAIAERYGTPLSLILQANPGLKADRIRIGQTLVIPHIPGAARPKQAAASYTVRSGDTLWAIASKFGIKAQALAKANNLGIEDFLHIGQVLKLPKS